MDEFIAIFETEARGERTFVSFTKLEPGRRYRVLNFRFINKQYNNKPGPNQVAIDLADYKWTLMPKHSASLLSTQEQLNELNSRNYTLIYNGVDEYRENMALFELVSSSSSSSSKRNNDEAEEEDSEPSTEPSHD